MRINLINAYLYNIAYTNTMKARLNITIDEDVLRSVKYFAEAQNSSVSELVENYFKTIVKPKKKKTLSELIKELPKPNIPENFDWKEAYYKAKKKKYGL
jgi:hypothetical protein